jgi:transposase
MGAAQIAESAVALNDGRKRRYRSKLERRQIVEETLKPGTSVSLVARAHDVNTNQVFKWVRQYHAGQFDVVQTPGALLPVKISDGSQKVQPALGHKSRARRTGIIDIDLGHARVHIEGTADPDCIRAAIESLAR